MIGWLVLSLTQVYDKKNANGDDWLKQNTYTNQYVSCRFTCNIVSFRSHLRVSWGWYWSSYVMLIDMRLKAHLAFEVLYEWLCILPPANHSFLRPFNNSKRLLHRLVKFEFSRKRVKTLLKTWTSPKPAHEKSLQRPELGCLVKLR